MKKIGFLLICFCFVLNLLGCQPENNDKTPDKPQIETEMDFSDFE